MTIKQTTSFSTIADEPLRNFKFQVSFLPSNPGLAVTPVMGFMTMSGLGMQVDVIAYRQGGANSVTQKMPGQADFGALTFTNGVIIGGQSMASFQINWMKTIISVIQGVSPPRQNSLAAIGPGGTPDFRATAQVLILEHPSTGPDVHVLAAFELLKAWPSVLQYSDLDAGANEVLVAQMTINYEGFNVNLASAPGSDATIPTGT